MPKINPTTIPVSAPVPLIRLKNTPNKKTAAIGGAKYDCTL
jgi:hypothetical protein